MSENDEKDYIVLLKEIFHFSENSSDIYPIVQNSDKIDDFKQYLENKNIDNIKKYQNSVELYKLLIGLNPDFNL